MDGAELIAAWRVTLSDLGKSWVLFEKGTCVVCTEPGSDLTTQATALLRKFGPVGGPSPIGDFAATIPLPDGRGWLVAGHHSDILTFVGRSDVPPGASDVAIGQLGRSKRGQDVEQLRVLQVEDNRHATRSQDDP